MEERRRLLNNTPVSYPHTESVSNWRLKFGKSAVLLTVAFERCAFYSLSGNLVLFFTKKPFSWMSYHAILVSFFFFGISYLTSFFGGFIGDAVAGRFKTLVLSFLIYGLGYSLMPVISNSKTYDSKLPSICWPNINSTGSDDISPFEEKCSLTVYLTLFVIGIGTGVFRANMPPFGGDQAQDQTRGEGQTTFFNWYYWSINIGTLIALSFFTWLQQVESFFKGYLAAVVCLGLSFFIFLSGSCSYTYKPRTRTVLRNVSSVVKEAVCRRWNRKSLRTDTSQTVYESSLTENRNNVEDALENSPACCLDYAKFQYGGNFNDSQVEDVKKLGKILCVFFALVPYWMVYFQMQTTFLLQGLHMKLNLTAEDPFDKSECHMNETGRHDLHGNSSIIMKDDKSEFQIVAAWFSLFDVIFVIILIPIVDRFLYPRLARAGRPITMIQRISIGMLFSCLAVLLAGFVEYQRLKLVFACDQDGKPDCSNNDTFIQTIGNTNYTASSMNVFWQIPQYALIGISEVFACVAGIDFAYQMAPRSMKGIIMGLFYLFTGIGSFLGIATMYAFQGIWFFGKDYINCRLCENGTVKHQCHLDYYFFFLSVFQLVALLIFVIVAKKLHLARDLRIVGSPPSGAPSSAIPGVVDNPPSYTATDSPPKNSYGRKSAVRVSIQREPSSEINNS